MKCYIPLVGHAVGSLLARKASRTGVGWWAREFCWLVYAQGQAVAWYRDNANVHDKRFRPLAHRFDGETMSFCDRGFVKVGEPVGPYEGMSGENLERMDDY